MTAPEEHDARVALCVEYLDARYEGDWRALALSYAIEHPRPLWHAVQGVAGDRPPFYDDGMIHDWNLAHGLTIDYGHLGYPEPGETPRLHRERRAWAELDAAWWRALAP